MMEYYSVMKKEILPFMTTWIDLENIMLSEISQRNTNTICSHIHVESKKAKLGGYQGLGSRGKRRWWSKGTNSQL